MHEWRRSATHEIEAQMTEHGYEDWLVLHRRLKWSFAGKTVRRRDERWTTVLLTWQPPPDCGRNVGHPISRWDDGFVAIAGGDCPAAAKDEDLWATLEDAYVFNVV